MQLKTLNELSIEMQRLVFESDGEITAEIEAFTEKLGDKVDSYGWLLDEIPYKIESLKKRVSALEAVIKRYQTLEKSLDFKLDAAMKRLNVTELSGNEYRFSYATCKRSVEVYDVNLIPDEFFRIKKEPNKDAIKIALDNNLKVDGVRLTGGLYIKKQVI